MSTTNKLTDSIIRAAKPREKPFKLADGGGLFLLVKAAGKYWRMAYRFAGKERTLAIGTYPQITLKAARARREEAREQLVNGIDPCLQKQRDKRARVAASESSFRVVACEWIEKQRPRWGAEHPQRVLRSLELAIFPDLGLMPIREITAEDLLLVLRKVESKGATDTAARVLQRAGAVFRYGIASGRCASNPAADLKGALTPHVGKNQAALPLSEFPELFRRLDAYQGRPETRLAIRLLILTGVRTAELRGARWAEFDLSTALWTIPAERMKLRREHVVPLSRQAENILRELHAITGSFDLLFPGVRNPRAPMSENTVLYTLYRLGYHSRATGHGFRTAFSTWANEHGFPADHIERQLAHVPANAVRRVYNRAEYLPGRVSLMQAWADHLEQLQGGNVVPLIRRA